MKNQPSNHEELSDWVDALENLILFNGKEDASSLVNEFFKYAENKGLIDQKLRNLPFEKYHIASHGAFISRRLGIRRKD